MAEFDSGSLHIVSTRLRNLLLQVNAASSDDLSNEDVRAALTLMRGNLVDLIQEISEAADYSDALREGILLAASEHIYVYSDVLGTIIRSNTTRNPFELYFPFKEISRAFFPEEKVYLILSSEWRYVPFTYPFSLDELPDFILIGMPAPEADNVLAFPLAGHELGHSIWKRKGLVSNFSAAALELARQRFENSPELLKSLYPGVSEDQFENDLFSSRLKDTAISDIITFCMLQTEEVFCDLIGARIFGGSYLQAFRYLLAPTARGPRTAEYPDIQERATLLDRYCDEMGMPDVGLARWFNKEDDIAHPFYSQLVRLADSVRRDLWPVLTRTVDEVVADAEISPVRADVVTTVRDRFQSKMPVEGDVSLGELVCGAWGAFEGSFVGALEDSEKAEFTVSNLVLKSAEAMEFKARMTVAG